jgi:hypothetical protein
MIALAFTSAAVIVAAGTLALAPWGAQAARTPSRAAPARQPRPLVPVGIAPAGVSYEALADRYEQFMAARKAAEEGGEMPISITITGDTPQELAEEAARFAAYTRAASPSRAATAKAPARKPGEPPARPVCDIHKISREGKHGLFCPAKDEGGNYCQWAA